MPAFELVLIFGFPEPLGCRAKIPNVLTQGVSTPIPARSGESKENSSRGMRSERHLQPIQQQGLNPRGYGPLAEPSRPGNARDRSIPTHPRGTAAGASFTKAVGLQCV